MTRDIVAVIKAGWHARRIILVAGIARWARHAGGAARARMGAEPWLIGMVLTDPSATITTDAFHRAGASKGFYPGALIFSMDIAFSGSQIGAMEQPHKAIRCPQCGSLMSLASAPGGKGPRSMRCLQCEGLDPLKASEVGGWLKGELQPPK